jgi:chromosome segregation ATPase
VEKKINCLLVLFVVFVLAIAAYSIICYSIINRVRSDSAKQVEQYREISKQIADRNGQLDIAISGIAGKINTVITGLESSTGSAVGIKEAIGKSITRIESVIEEFKNYTAEYQQLADTITGISGESGSIVRDVQAIRTEIEKSKNN